MKHPDNGMLDRLENDVLLAAASGAIIIGFHVRPTPAAKTLAESENVEIKLYEIIYEVYRMLKTL